MLVEVIFLATFFLVVLWFSTYFMLMLYFSRKPSKINKKEMIFPTVSIVIPAFNEEKVILKKLQSIIEIDYPRDKMEALVVDDGSTDNTRKIVEEFITSNNANLKFSLLPRRERGGKANALNDAFKLCNGEIVVISDADVFFKRDAIINMLANFNDSTVGAVSGIEVMANPDDSSATEMEQGYRSFYNTLRLGETNFDSVMMCESGFSAYRRQLLDALPERCVCDDMELTLMIKNKGLRAVYDPKVEFHEYSPVTFVSEIKQKIRRGQGNQRTLLRFAKLMVKNEKSRFAHIILPSEFFMHLIAPILIPISILFFLLSLMGPNSLLVFLISAITLVSDFSMIYLGLKLASPATDITLQYSSRARSKSKRPFEPLVMIADFLMLQLCLLIGLISLLLGRSMHKWQKIEETRRF